jgi:hypothetical protein
VIGQSVNWLAAALCELINVSLHYHIQMDSARLSLLLNVYLGIFPGVKRPKREADNSHPFSAEVKAIQLRNWIMILRIYKMQIWRNYWKELTRNKDHCRASRQQLAGRMWAAAASWIGLRYTVRLQSRYHFNLFYLIYRLSETCSVSMKKLSKYLKYYNKTE